MPRDTFKSLTAAAVTPEYSVLTPAQIAAREVTGFSHIYSAADVAAATRVMQEEQAADNATIGEYEEESQALFDAASPFARSYVATACQDVEYKTGDPRSDSDKRSDVNPSDLTPDTIRDLIATAQDFRDANAELIERAMELSGNDESQAGYDLYHTQVGSGVGYWETPDWPEAEGEELTELAKELGECNLMTADDGSVVGC